jgi:hypothetical protein
MCLVTDTQTTKREANLPQTRPCNNGNNDTNINNNIYNNNNVKNNSEHGVNYCSHPNNQHAGNHANTNDTTNNSPNVSTTIPSLKLSTIILWSILTYISKEFSLFLPRFQSKAGAKIFISASYNYDDDLSFFDDTILTWGTDYAICIIMLFASYQCFNATTNYSKGILLDRSKSKSLRIKSSLLFFSYAISVFAGGYAHYTFTEGTDQRNTTPFRIWWTI